MSPVRTREILPADCVQGSLSRVYRTLSAGLGIQCELTAESSSGEDDSVSGDSLLAVERRWFLEDCGVYSILSPMLRWHFTVNSGRIIMGLDCLRG